MLFSLLTFALPAHAQMLPQGANVNLYFPQIADGGTGSGRWQTTFSFLNCDSSASATVKLWLIRDDGSGLAMDFGSGASSYHTFTIPPSGSRVLRSAATSPVTAVGWAIAETSVPVQAVAAYRQFVGDVPKQEISVHPTLPTIAFRSPASRLLGVALANRYNYDPITVNLEILDSEGRRLADPVQVTVPALGHAAFYVYQKFPAVADFSGTLLISAANSTYPYNDQFVAMTINSDVAGIWSGLPPGSASWPIAHWERIKLVYSDLVNTAIRHGFLSTPPTLTVDTSHVINAYASSNGTVTITLAISQLISDSPSELAWIIGHELGHIYQFTHGMQLLFDTNIELDADVWGTILSLLAGYDPYAGAGVLGKLAMASGRAGILAQLFDNLTDPHTSFANRLDSLYNTLVTACSASSDTKAACDSYKKAVHPDFPGNAPLAVGKPNTNQ